MNNLAYSSNEAYGRVYATNCYGKVCATKELHPVLMGGVKEVK